MLRQQLEAEEQDFSIMNAKFTSLQEELDFK